MAETPRRFDGNFLIFLYAYKRRLLSKGGKNEKYQKESITCFMYVYRNGVYGGVLRLCGNF